MGIVGNEIADKSANKGHKNNNTVLYNLTLADKRIFRMDAVMQIT